jgi:hypothetical protein
MFIYHFCFSMHIVYRLRTSHEISSSVQPVISILYILSFKHRLVKKKKKDMVIGNCYLGFSFFWTSYVVPKILIEDGYLFFLHIIGILN